MEEITQQVIPEQSPPQNLPTAQTKTPKWIVILLLIFFPPIAWYFMWRELRYHRWFPILLILYGALILGLSSIVLLFVIPQLYKLYDSLNIPIPKTSYLYYLLPVFGIVQIIFGFYLRRKVIQKGLSKNLLWLIITLLSLEFIFASFTHTAMSLLAVTHTYNITSEFDKDSSQVQQPKIPTPTSNPTANWKTYRDDAYNLEFKYPSAWKIVARKSGNWPLELQSPTVEIYENKISEPYRIPTKGTFINFLPPVSYGKKDQSLEEFIKGRNFYNEGSIKEYSISSNNAAEYTYTQQSGTESYDHKEILILKDDRLYEISRVYKTNEESLYEEIFQQILSTFKFLNTSTSPTCIPRPACLDATPRCLIPETSDMCSK